MYCESGASLPRFALEEGCDFVTIAADCHRAPTATMGAGIIVEEKPALGIGAAAYRRVRALGQEFGGGACNGRQKPLQALLSGDVQKAPGVSLVDEFVVPFGDSKDFVNGLYHSVREGFLSHRRRKDDEQSFAQAQYFLKDTRNCFWFG